MVMYSVIHLGGQELREITWSKVSLPQETTQQQSCQTWMMNGRTMNELQVQHTIFKIRTYFTSLGINHQHLTREKDIMSFTGKMIS